MTCSLRGFGSGRRGLVPLCRRRCSTSSPILLPSIRGLGAGRTRSSMRRPGLFVLIRVMKPSPFCSPSGRDDCAPLPRARGLPSRRTSCTTHRVIEDEGLLEPEQQEQVQSPLNSRDFRRGHPDPMENWTDRRPSTRPDCREITATSTHAFGGGMNARRVGRILQSTASDRAADRHLTRLKALMSPSAPTAATCTSTTDDPDEPARGTWR